MHSVVPLSPGRQWHTRVVHTPSICRPGATVYIGVFALGAESSPGHQTSPCRASSRIPAHALRRHNGPDGPARVVARVHDGRIAARSLDWARQAPLGGSKPLVPPAPEPAPDVVGPFELARRMRTNGVTVYARPAYEEEVLRRSFFGRASLVLN